jgi:hypothetical protein
MARRKGSPGLAAALAAGVICSCGGAAQPAASPTGAATAVRLTSQQLCSRLSLSTLRRITGDDWARVAPHDRAVGCDVTASGPPQMTVSVEDLPGAGNPRVAAFARSIFRTDTAGAAWEPVAGLGDMAAFDASTGSLLVLRGTTIYQVQLVSDHLPPARTLDATRQVLALVG